MSHDANFDLCEPFDIDNGELDGLTPQECFVLGVEWCQFWKLLDDGTAFELTVHERNASRLQALAVRHKRDCSVHWIHEDHAGWRLIRVGDYFHQDES